jgi:hypothetical protein
MATTAMTNIILKLRYKLFREAFIAATKLDGLNVIEIDGQKVTRDMHFSGENRAYVDYMRTWGEADTVKMKTKMPPKIHDLGVK